MEKTYNRIKSFKPPKQSKSKNVRMFALVLGIEVHPLCGDHMLPQRLPTNDPQFQALSPVRAPRYDDGARFRQC